ncbi:MAG: outer membrane protein [Methylocella sp.]
MLRRLLLTSAGAMALTGAALAADLPSRAPPPVFLPPPPLFNWTGFYVGINAGYHWSNSTLQFLGADSDGDAVGGGLGVAQDFGVIPLTGASNSSGFIGGGGFGYNYQINSFVLGLEVDFDGATGSGNSSVVLDNPGAGFTIPTLTQSQQRLEWLGTLRGRIGWTPIDHLLIYGTGGLAFGQSNASFSVVNPLAVPPLSAFASNEAHVGWTAGGGVEYALPDNWSNWSVKVEYLYYDLGHTTGTVTYQNIDLVGATEFSSLSGQVRHTGNIVRAGLNYKFNWGNLAPVVAKY